MTAVTSASLEVLGRQNNKSMRETHLDLLGLLSLLLVMLLRAFTVASILRNKMYLAALDLVRTAAAAAQWQVSYISRPLDADAY